jgi:hypothetical protein
MRYETKDIRLYCLSVKTNGKALTGGKFVTTPLIEMPQFPLFQRGLGGFFEFDEQNPPSSL